MRIVLLEFSRNMFARLPFEDINVAIRQIENRKEHGTSSGCYELFCKLAGSYSYGLLFTDFSQLRVVKGDVSA